MNTLRFTVLFALVGLAAFATERPEAKKVRVKAFDVPEEVHDGVRLEVARWPGLLAGSSKAGDMIRFLTKGETRWVLAGRGRVVDRGKKLILTAELTDQRDAKQVWSGKYELTDISKKVQFLAEVREKIEAGVRASLSRKR